MNEFLSGPHTNLGGAGSLRIGLLVDSVIVSAYVYDFVNWAQSRQNITVTPIILKVEPVSGFPKQANRSASRSGPYSAISDLAFSILETYERKKIKRDKQHRDHLREIDLSSLVKETLTAAPAISESNDGLVYRFNDSDIRKINDHKFDLLLSYEWCDLSDEIFNASRLGLICLHGGDDRATRGGPVGFWEVYFQQDTTGFTIRRHSNDRSAGDVLMRGRFATRHYYLLNQAFVSRKSNHYLKLTIEKISEGQLPNATPNLPYSRRLFDAPTAFEVGIYAARRLFTSFTKWLKRVLKIDNRWNVAFIHRDWREAELGKANKIKNRSFHSLADPFVISKNGRNYCFAEDLDHREARGTIVVYELGDSDSTLIGTALDESFHLSFPYLFEFKGELFMCPESSASRDIRIYKCLDFPLKWKLEKIIMENISAADTMLFEKGGSWWMLSNIDPVGVGDHCSELYVYSANSPFSGDWRPHPNNPVIVDASCARNAGCVIDGERCFRFSQGQGFDFYGKRLVINEITELTNSAYRETRLSVLTPSFSDEAIGIHHMHSNGRITVFDFVERSRIKVADEPANIAAPISATAKDQSSG